MYSLHLSRPLKSFALALCLCLPAGSALWAQASAKSDTAADTAWTNLTKLANNTVTAPSKGSTTNSQKKAAEQLAAEEQQKVASLKQAAQNARDFYTAYPSDPRAAQAKKIEATSALQTISYRDADKGNAVIQAATIYRKDTANAAKDRLEVASLIERQKYSAQNNGKSLSKDGAQHEKVADSLRTEFGDIPEVYSFYLGVVNTADFETAKRVAQKVAVQPSPSYSKTEAQVTLDRYALIGKVSTDTFKADDGNSVSLGQVGKPTIVFVWTPRQNLNQFAALAAHKKLIPADARWVYVSVGSTAGPFNAAKTKAPFAGIHLFEPLGTEGPVTKALKIRHMPYVYVLDRRGALAGYGSVDELPELLKLIAR